MLCLLPCDNFFDFKCWWMSRRLGKGVWIRASSSLIRTHSCIKPLISDLDPNSFEVVSDLHQSSICKCSSFSNCLAPSQCNLGIDRGNSLYLLWVCVALPGAPQMAKCLHQANELEFLSLIYICIFYIETSNMCQKTINRIKKIIPE